MRERAELLGVGSELVRRGGNRVAGLVVRQIGADEAALSHVQVLGISLQQLRTVMYDLPFPPGERHRNVDPCPLSARELEVLKRLAQGKVYKQIAHELELSTSTVRTHLHNIYGKLGAVDRAQAVLVANERGWI